MNYKEQQKAAKRRFKELGSLEFLSMTYADKEWNAKHDVPFKRKGNTYKKDKNCKSS